MKTMAYEVQGTIMVLVHTTAPPSDEEWQEYVNALKAMTERRGEEIRLLVVTSGGGPSFSQRQLTNRLIKSRQMVVAVVTDNAFARGIVVAISVFFPRIRAFRSDAIEEALRYLQVSEAERKTIFRTVAKLRASLHEEHLKVRR